MALERTQGGESYQRTTKAAKSDSRAISGPATGIVTCGACQNFEPGEPNPRESMGRCGVTNSGLPPPGGTGHGAPFPRAPRTCRSYQPLEESC